MSIKTRPSKASTVEKEKTMKDMTTAIPEIKKQSIHAGGQQKILDCPSSGMKVTSTYLTKLFRNKQKTHWLCHGKVHDYSSISKFIPAPIFPRK